MRGPVCTFWVNLTAFLLKDGDGERDYGLKVGDSQKFQFGTTVEGEPAPDPPLAFPKNRLPYLDHSLPRHNVAGADGKVIEGWEGKSKGVRQILFESRQFKKGMVSDAFFGTRHSHSARDEAREISPSPSSSSSRYYFIYHPVHRRIRNK